MKKQQFIEYGGKNEELFQKQSLSHCDYGTKIIVPPTHSAVFLKDGEMMNILESGAHDVFEIQKVGLFRKKPTSCTVDVIFMSKTAKLQVKWGTPSPFYVKDPITDTSVEVACSGEFEVQIGNPKQFYLQLVGANCNYNVDDLKERLKSRIYANVEELLAREIREKNIPYDKFSEQKNNIAKGMKEVIGKMFKEDYGLTLYSFTLMHVKFTDEAMCAIKEHLQRMKDESKSIVKKIESD